jgi:tetratricopeptide (TPR) repeat protein
MMQKTEKSHLFLISAGLVLLIGAAFEPLRHNAFINYDDNKYITENPHIQSGITIQSIKWAFTSTQQSNWHPLTWLSHMLDIELFGLDPLGHHLHNLLLHTISTVLLFWLLYKMTGAVWCSAFVAMAFGIHPLRVESVAWAAERKDVLGALFWMLTIAAYLYYVKRGGIYRYLLVILCFAMGLMAKPMLVTLPIVLLLLDFWPLGRVSGNMARLVVEKIPLLILVLASCIITYQVQQSGGSVTLHMSPDVLVTNALGAYTSYLGKLVWPVDLAVLYPMKGVQNPHDKQWPAGYLVLAFSILLAGCALAAARHRKKPYLLTGWFWYVITLIPVIGIVRIGAHLIADRYTYLPSIGIAILVAWTMKDLSKHWPYRKRILAAACGLLAAAMILGTRTQSAYWKDSVTLYEHTLAVTRNNYIIYNNLGCEYLGMGKLDKAKECFRTATQEINPAFADANYNMAILLGKQGQYEDAINYLRGVLSVEPDNTDANYNIALLLGKQGQYAGTIDYLYRVIQAEPANPEHYHNMIFSLIKLRRFDEAADYLNRRLQLESNKADRNTEMADILIVAKEPNAAADFLGKAMTTNPDKAAVYSKTGALLQSQNKIDEAIALYQEALRIKPDDNKIYWELASTLVKMKRYSQAVDAYRRLLQLEPNHLLTLNNLAWILATTPDSTIRNPAEAAPLALKACQMSQFKNPNYLDTLAAAYAAAGQFKEAIEAAQKAIDQAKTTGQTQLVEEVTKHLQLYQASKPYYDPPSSPPPN